MEETDPPRDDQPSRALTILVVEDDADIGAYLLDALKEETSFHVLLVGDGAHALEAVNTLVPDLFLLDYQLPGLSGLELADRFQATETLKAIPIVLMSAARLEQDLSQRHITFLEKPFSLQQLLQTIRTCTEPCGQVE